MGKNQLQYAILCYKKYKISFSLCGRFSSGVAALKRRREGGVKRRIKVKTIIIIKYSFSFSRQPASQPASRQSAAVAVAAPPHQPPTRQPMPPPPPPRSVVSRQIPKRNLCRLTACRVRARVAVSHGAYYYYHRYATRRPDPASAVHHRVYCFRASAHRKSLRRARHRHSLPSNPAARPSAQQPHDVIS